MNSTKVTKVMKQIRTVKNRRQLRMLRGRFETFLRQVRLSYQLQDSALREFDRVASANHPAGLPY